MSPLPYLRLILLAGLTFLTSCSTPLTDESRKAELEKLPVSSHPVLAKAGLIDIAEVDPSVRVQLQYKGPTPISDKPLYPPQFPALLKPETAVRLKHANSFVKEHGLRILIWDAYRPPSAQRELWNASGYNDTYVANPDNAPSQHSCGTAVDVTLVRANGAAVKMPTGFDSFEPTAASNYHHKDPVIRRNLKILQSTMRRAGFYPLPAEWWHYIDKNYQKYPQTIPLTLLQGAY